ncbi:MAG: translation initiation factor IF-2, partial [archaeon]|nr:translation initiation factor IF-2 [archaeon]
LGFNVKTLKNAEEEANIQGIRIFYNDVIYRLMEEFKDYYETRVKEEKDQAFSGLIMPGKAEIIPDFIFRRSDPVVCGVKVIAGKLTPKHRLINQDGVMVGKLKQIQDNNVTIKEAEAGKEVAVSITNATIGRNLKETDTIYILMPESHVRILNGKYRSEMSDEQLKLIREFMLVMRKKNSPFWGA